MAALIDLLVQALITVSSRAFAVFLVVLVALSLALVAMLIF
jgi:hypothetical protein